MEFERGPEFKKDEIEDILTERDQHRQYLEQIGVEFNEIYLSKRTDSNSQQFARLLLSAINASQADLLVTGASIGKYDLFNNQHFISMLDKLNCPTIIAKKLFHSRCKQDKVANNEDISKTNLTRHESIGYYKETIFLL